MESIPADAGEEPDKDPDEGPSLLTRLNQHGFRLVMLLDGVLLFLLPCVIMVVRFGWVTDWPSFPLAAYLLSFTVSALIFTASLYFGGLYEREPRLGRAAVLPRAARQSLAAGGIIALLNLALTGFARELGLTTSRALPFPFVNLVAFIVLSGVAITVNRWIVDRVRTRREGPPRVVLAGEPADLELAARHVASEERRVQVVAEVSRPQDVVRAVAQHDATDVVIVSSAWLDPLYPAVIVDLDDAGITILLRVSGQETLMGLRRLRQVGGLPFVLLLPQTMTRSQLRYKRMIDLVVLVGAAPLWLGALLFATVYQRVVAGRPLLYRQTRVGANGRTFEMVKFRTMREDAEADDLGARLAEQHDPRVISADEWVRATRLDELPQIWNIARGEMSFVGPRPERPELTKVFERKIAGYARRYEVPPGLTGLAQIHGRYHTDPEYKLGYDLQYLVNWSPVLDLEIAARTVWVVLSRRL